MIKIKLSEILGEYRITQKQLSILTGIRPNSISEICNEFCEKIDVNYLDRICKALKCQVSDLLEYVPDEQDGK